MAGTGPPKSKNTRRRNQPAPSMLLPAHGYAGEIPDWPLPPNAQLTGRVAATEAAIVAAEEELADAKRKAPVRAKIARLRQALARVAHEIAESTRLEVELWGELWRTPQAAQWAHAGWVREVAQYCRWKVQAELGDLAAGKEARMWADRLGLHPTAMARLGWEVAGDELAEARQARQAASARSRVRAVDPDAVAGG